MNRRMGIVVKLAVARIVEILLRSHRVYHFACVGTPLGLGCCQRLYDGHKVDIFVEEICFCSWVRNQAFVVQFFCGFHSLRSAKMQFFGRKLLQFDCVEWHWFLFILLTAIHMRHFSFLGLFYFFKQHQDNMSIEALASLPSKFNCL